MKTKSLIEKQLKRKKNLNLVYTIISAKKNDKWKEVAEYLSRPTRKRININLSEIDNLSNDGDRVVIPGKVLSEGELSKKIEIIAFAFSERAIEKIKNAKCSFNFIINEIKKNPEAKNVKILK